MKRRLNYSPSVLAGIKGEVIDVWEVWKELEHFI